MPLTIVKETDPVTIKQLVLLVYGQPGRGKTSMAQTADTPLTLDFDGGIHRSGFRRDSVPVNNWTEVANLSRDDLQGYKTVVVDTAGRCLDKITAHLIETNPKAAGAAGNLTLQGYGELKATFASWLKRLRECGVDVILTAHDAEDKQGDDIITRPDMQGGSKQEIIKAADAIGYLYSSRQGTILDFNATDKWIGKNCAGFDPIKVPDFAAEPAFMAGIMQKTKDRLNEQSETQKKAISEVDQWRSDIEEITDPASLSKLIPTATKHAQSKALRQIIWNHAKAMGWEYDKSKKSFYVPNPETEDTASDSTEDMASTEE